MVSFPSRSLTLCIAEHVQLYDYEVFSICISNFIYHLPVYNTAPPNNKKDNLKHFPSFFTVFFCAQAINPTFEENLSRRNAKANSNVNAATMKYTMLTYGI